MLKFPSFYFFVHSAGKFNTPYHKPPTPLTLILSKNACLWGFNQEGSKPAEVNAEANFFWIPHRVDTRLRQRQFSIVLQHAEKEHGKADDRQVFAKRIQATGAARGRLNGAKYILSWDTFIARLFEATRVACVLARCKMMPSRNSKAKHLLGQISLTWLLTRSLKVFCGFRTLARLRNDNIAYWTREDRGHEFYNSPLVIELDFTHDLLRPHRLPFDLHAG